MTCFAARPPHNHCTMQLYDFDGSVIISNEGDLLTRLKSVRRGNYGAFELSHENDFPALFVEFNRNIAYMHYFPAEEHPGYQPKDMTPDGCPNVVHFLPIKGSEADSIDMPDYALVSAETAYAVAVEFFRSPDLPRSVSWFEL